MLRRSADGVILLALGASWGAVASLRDLRQAEDDPTSEYWLHFFARLDGAVGGVSFLSAAAVLWLRSRVRR